MEIQCTVLPSTAVRISHAHKFVFLAYPRTASTSMRDLLDPFCEIKSIHISQITRENPFYHHISAVELRTIFEERGWDWSLYRKFAVVRNPYDRVVSLYHHHDRHYRPTGESSPNLAERLKRYVWRRSRFARYVGALDPRQRLHCTFHSFLGDGAGGCLVDHILRFEYLETEAPRLLSALGLPLFGVSMPRLNQSDNRSAYRRYYNSRSRELVNGLYTEDIERFSYMF